MLPFLSLQSTWKNSQVHPSPLSSNNSIYLWHSLLQLTWNAIQVYHFSSSLLLLHPQHFRCLSLSSAPMVLCYWEAERDRAVYLLNAATEYCAMQWWSLWRDHHCITQCSVAPFNRYVALTFSVSQWAQHHRNRRERERLEALEEEGRRKKMLNTLKWQFKPIEGLLCFELYLCYAIMINFKFYLFIKERHGHRKLVCQKEIELSEEKRDEWTWLFFQVDWRYRKGSNIDCILIRLKRFGRKGVGFVDA